MNLGQIIEGEICSIYAKYCSKSCPKRLEMDTIDEDIIEKVITAHCDNCIIKHFLKEGLEIK